ncbi:MAG: hypothetical protein ACI83B_001299 [Sediminicola sp.]
MKIEEAESFAEKVLLHYIKVKSNRQRLGIAAEII